MSSHRSPSEVRASLKHPIIDGDGHWVEYNPVFAERMRKLAGDKAADGFLLSQRRIPDALKLSIAQRKERGIAMEGYWTRQSTNTRDRATAMMPRMLYDRLDELGIDFGIIYPTAGLSVPRIQDDATRRAVCRGFNLVTAEYFGKLSDRLTPAAVIPMFTPEEAIEELEFCVKQLGAKGIAYMDPKKLDRALLKSLVDKYGDSDMIAELAKRDGWPSKEEDEPTGGVTELDDFAACKITRKQDWVDLYAKPYYFGCEADDRMNVTAFGRANPFGAKINAIFSSDIGHFDVPDMLQPVPEAYELVEDGLITPADFRDFTFANGVRLWGTQNPDFFKGTAIARQAAEVLDHTYSPVRAAAE